MSEFWWFMKGLFVTLIILSISLIFVSILLISGWDIKLTGESIKELCGDGVCEIGESCSCVDCVGNEICKEKEKINCDDSNICTIDRYNEDFDKCEYEDIKPCCGDGICEESERCNDELHKTMCDEDCKVRCPAFVVVSDLKCGENCKKVGDKFLINGDGYLEISLENLGEEGTTTVSGKFDCDSELRKARLDYESIFGVVFNDYFDNVQEKLSGISGKDKSIYRLNFGLENIERDFEADCLVILDGNVFTENRDFKVVFEKS